MHNQYKGTIEKSHSFSIGILFMSQGSLAMETKKIFQGYEHTESETSMRPMMCTVLQKKCQVPQAVFPK